MNDRVRNQHVVSKFYLKGFADQRSRLRRLILPGLHSHLISVNKATVIRDYYSLTLDDGRVTDVFESAFSKIESVAAKTLRRLTKGGAWPLNSADKYSMALWIALQYLRSEGVRGHEAESEAILIRLLVGLSGKEALREYIMTAEQSEVSQARLDFEWNELTQDGGPRLRQDAGEHLGMVVDLLFPTAALFASKQWTLYDFERGPLVTGDHPVTLSEAPEGSGLGLYTAGVIALPLSRLQAILLRTAPGIDVRETGTHERAEHLNQLTILNSRKFVLSHPEDLESIESLHLPDPRTSERDPGAAGRFISEVGYLGPVGRGSAGRIAAIFSRSGKAVTLSDIKWPIERRLVVWDTSDYEKS